MRMSDRYTRAKELAPHIESIAGGFVADIYAIRGIQVTPTQMVQSVRAVLKALAADKQFCRRPSYCAGMSSCPMEYACND